MTELSVQTSTFTSHLLQDYVIYNSNVLLHNHPPDCRPTESQIPAVSFSTTWKLLVLWLHTRFPQVHGSEAVCVQPTGEAPGKIYFTPFPGLGCKVKVWKATYPLRNSAQTSFLLPLIVRKCCKMFYTTTLLYLLTLMFLQELNSLLW